MEYHYPIYQSNLSHPSVGIVPDMIILVHKIHQRTAEKYSALWNRAKMPWHFSAAWPQLLSHGVVSTRDQHMQVTHLYGYDSFIPKHQHENQISFDLLIPVRRIVEPYIRPQTKAIYIETPTNPMMNVTDIAKIATITKQHGILLIVDNTFLSPYFQNPLTLGADIVIHSGTKFIGGHNDTIAGFLVVNNAELSEQLHYITKTVGSGLAPFDCWLIIRGLKTLGIRMERQQENAFAIANWLLTHPRVKNVYYPGLPNHPGYEICKKQATGFGSMLTFQVDSPETALRILRSVKLIPFAESLGGVETLMYLSNDTKPISIFLRIKGEDWDTDPLRYLLEIEDGMCNRLI